MTEALAQAEEILTTNKKALDEMSAELITQETIDRDDFEKLLLLHGIKPKRVADRIDPEPVTIAPEESKTAL